MALTYNDLQTRAWSYTEAGADALDVTSGAAVRLMAVSLQAGAVAADLKIYDALTITGTPVLQLNSAIQTTRYINLGPNGMRLSTGLTTDLSTLGSDTYTLFYLVED
jgi:hypothetical protein